MPGVLHGDGRPEPELEVDDDNVLHVPTLDEAIALALAMCPDGESFTVHEAACEVEGNDLSTCTCVPQTYTKGATA